MAYDLTHCTACGASGDLHEHHIVPTAQGGTALPTVYLCVPCHAAVYTRTWNPEHVKLTRAVLAAAKTGGKKLGGWRGGPKVDPALGTAVRARQAVTFAASLHPIISETRERGLSLRGIVAELQRRKIKTAAGGKWSAQTVARILGAA